MIKRKSNLLFMAILAISDILMINLALLLAYWVRFHSNIIPLRYGTTSLKDYVNILAFVSITLLVILRSYGLYATRRRLSKVDEFFVLAKAVTVSMLFLMALTFLYRQFSYSRIMIAFAWIFNIPLLAISRSCIDKLEDWQIRVKGDFRKVLIVGTGKISRRLAETLKNQSKSRSELVGFISCSSIKDDHFNEVPVLGDLESLPKVISSKKVNEVILTEPGIARQRLMNTILECEKYMVSFKMVPDLLGVITSQVDMQILNGIALLGLKDSPLNEAYNRFLKRSLDIFGALSGLILLCPVFLIIAFAIKINSKGPVFYLQKRIGEDAKRFTLYKFRTMRPGAEKGTGPVWAKADDKRRTKVGTFLRRYNLDELPQLWNVLKGDMSLVGPRPERPHFVSKFKEDIPRYMTRHKIKSGMTGWAQVNGLRGDTSIEERTKYDLYYIENWSLLFDIKVLLMSLAATKNAY